MYGSNRILYRLKTKCTVCIAGVKDSKKEVDELRSMLAQNAAASIGTILFKRCLYAYTYSRICFIHVLMHAVIVLFALLYVLSNNLLPIQCSLPSLHFTRSGSPSPLKSRSPLFPVSIISAGANATYIPSSLSHDRRRVTQTLK